MPFSRSDRLWLDEYTKRNVMRKVYGASSMAASWTLYMKLVQMLLKKANGEKVAYHPKKTPAFIAGLSVLGYALTYLLTDQFASTTKLEAQRLAKRIGLDNEGAQQEEERYARAPSRVSWRYVLTPGGKTMALSLKPLPREEKQFERIWYRKLVSRIMISDIWGGMQYGALYGLFPVALRKAIARSADKNESFSPQVKLAAAGLLLGGYLCQYQLARYRTEGVLLTDNYEAREIAKRKGDLHEGVSFLSALFTGEQGNKNNPYLAYDRKWLKANTRARARFFSTNTLTSTIFYGAISVMGDMALKKAAGEPVLRNTRGEAIQYHPVKSTAVLAGALAAGGILSYITSLSEAQVHKQEDDRLAVRVTGQRPDAEGNIKEPAAQTQVPSTGYWQKKVTFADGAAHFSEGSEAGMEQVRKSKESEKNVLNDNLEPPEDFRAYDAAWLKRFQTLSFQKGLYTALANATFFGLFGTGVSMLLDKVGDPEKKLSFKKETSPYVMGGLAVVGAGFAYLANKEESLLRKLEDDRLAHRIKASENQKDIEEGEQAVLPTALPFPQALDSWQDRVAREGGVRGFARG